MCAMWLCVWGIPSRVRCPVLQWKHPGLQLRWSQVRIPLPGLPEADQAERQLGQRKRVGWQPPIGRGRWRGALLQAPGHIFLIDDCRRGGVVAAQWGKNS